MADNDPGANQMIEKMMEFLSQQNITLDKSEKLLRSMAEHTGAVAEEAAKATGKIKDLFKYTDDTCYPRRMADSSRNDMLFSSSDSAKPSAILRGKGSVEGTESRSNRSASVTCSSLQMNQLDLPGFSG